MNKVVIFQHRLLHYRMGLFELLRARCLEKSIELHLVHGTPTNREKIRNDIGALAWSHSVESWSLSISNQDLIWLPFPSNLRDADLVVLMQENRQLSNYPILLSKLWSKRKLAYWGTWGKFSKHCADGISGALEKLMLTKVDWWFAYTQRTVDVVVKAGHPLSQITCLNNAIDTQTFKQELAAISDVELANEKEILGIKSGAPVGIFCGSLYLDKKLDFLVEAIDRIHQGSSEFHCIVLGDGPSMPFMREAAVTRPWLHLMGSDERRKKALYFRMADFMLNPGLVGLHIVDAFCAGLVMVTTSGARHSPEIVYLRHGVNGMMTEDSVAEYAQSILALVGDCERLKKIRTAALADADVYTLDNMVKQFVDGIVKCLGR